MPPASHRRPSDAPTRARAPSCDRGDFAAGKMLSEGLPERGEITPEDLAQCITDINEKIAKLPEGPQLNPAASDEAVAAVCHSAARRLRRIFTCVYELERVCGGPPCFAGRREASATHGRSAVESQRLLDR